MVHLEQRRVNPIITDKLASGLRVVGQRLDSKTPLNDLIEYAGAPSRSVPSVFFQVDSDEMAEWYTIIRQLTPLQRNVLNKVLGSLTRSGLELQDFILLDELKPEEVLEPTRKVKVTVGVIRRAPREKLAELYGVGKLGAAFLKAVFSVNPF